MSVTSDKHLINVPNRGGCGMRLKIMLKCIVLAGIVGLLAVSSTRAGAPLGLDTKGLYLRADVGLIFQKDDQAFLLDASEERDEQNVSFDSGTVFALGVGYHFNSSLRSDIVLSHQPKRDDRDQYFNGGRAVDNIPNAWWTSALTSQTLMANVYFEPLKMNFKKFAPYVFGGLGLARHKLDGFSISAPSTTTMSTCSEYTNLS